MQLEDWKVDMLRGWFEKRGRAINNQDVICFSNVFDASIGQIEEALARFRKLADSQQEFGSSQPGDIVQCQPILTQAIQDHYHEAIYEPTSTYVSSSNFSYPFGSLSALSLASQNLTSTHSTDLSRGNYGIHCDNHHISTSSISADLSVSNPAWSDSFQSMIMKCIDADINARKGKGCGRVDTSIAQRGDVPCTLGCGRMFRSACDRNRHEETVYPKRYWVCHLCADLEDPDSNVLFTRLDKIQCHSTKYHSGQLRVERCKISDTRALYPRRCGICQYRFRSLKDRSNHVARRHWLSQT
jgi:hypothetical protein